MRLPLGVIVKPYPNLMTPQLNRRSFLRNTGMAAAAFAVTRPWLNSAARTVSPKEKLNIAAIGFGGVGGSNVKNSADENIVALCDLDLNRCGGTIKQFPKAALFTDFRKMLDEQKDIDAVIIATPDHSHAYIAMECMRRGKHVYVQKPISHSVFEARILTESAHKYKVVTQMGNQGHSGEGIRQVTEWIAAGLIGKVREVHTWTNRPIWPQSLEMDRPSEVQKAPDGMDWNQWCGPAPLRPFHASYHPGKWRAWWDFGTGSLGDMGCHIIDPAFMALNLRYPESVEGNVSTVYETFGKKTSGKHESYPRSSIVRFKFPARGEMPPVTLTWWDGGLMPQRPDELEDDMPFGDPNGAATSSATRASSSAAAMVSTRVSLMRTCARRPRSSTRPSRESLAIPMAMRRIGFAPARVASPLLRTSITRAHSPRWCSWAISLPVTPTVNCSGTARRWK